MSGLQEKKSRKTATTFATEKVHYNCANWNFAAFIVLKENTYIHIINVYLQQL